MLAVTTAQRTYLTQSPRRRPVVKLEIINRSDGAVAKTIQATPGDARQRNQLGIIGGSVRVDTSAEVMRTLSLSLADPNGELTMGVGGLIGPDKLYRVYKGYILPAPYGAGEVVLWPLGVFVLTGRPGIDGAGGARVVRMQGGDKACLANGRPEGTLEQAVTIAQGVTKTDAIRTLAGLYGETEFNLTSESTAVVPFDYPFEDSDSPWGAITRINDIPEPSERITRRLYDPRGRLTLAMDPGPDLERLPAVWTAAPVTTGFSQLVSASMEADLEEMGNASRVKWGSQYVTPGVVTIKDTASNSQTSVDRIGFRVREWLNGQPDELIRTLAEATARAQFELNRMRCYQERISLQMVEAPFLEPYDVLRAEEPVVSVAGNYQVLGLTFDLGNSGVTQVEGWRVRNLA